MDKPKNNNIMKNNIFPCLGSTLKQEVLMQQLIFIVMHSGTQKSHLMRVWQ
jgi:hypothetical protein